MHSYVLWAILAVNALTFAAFGIDKLRATQGWRRTPESTLLALSWATGLVGGWVAMTAFRHKTRKTSFRYKMVAVSLLNLLWPILYLLLRS